MCDRRLPFLGKLSILRIYINSKYQKNPLRIRTGYQSERPHTCIFRETYCKWRFPNFFLKQILFIKEKDDGGICEPFVVTYGIKELKTFLHSILKNNSSTLINLMKRTVKSIQLESLSG